AADAGAGTPADSNGSSSDSSHGRRFRRRFARGGAGGCVNIRRLSPTSIAALAATHPRFPTMPQLARRMSRAKPSVIMQVAEKAKRLKAEGRDIISFSIGVPNFLPGEHVYAAAREALAKDSGQYGSNRGTDALLDAFIEHMAKIGMTGYGRVNCSTGIGPKHILSKLGESLPDEAD